ncbi:MAG TPA: hypothetical protein VE618_02230 [Myxococcaceae bacterium]|nr:hypothetical protein [Myxococcaceae bacterium]
MNRSVRSRRVRVRWPAALAGLTLACGLLWVERADLAYLISPRDPISLGDESGYDFERLTSNRFAEIHGIPTAGGAYSRDGDRIHVVVGLRNTPVLLRREALPTEDWVPRRPPPAPDPRPLGARGRLLAEEDAPRYQSAFEMLGRELTAKDGQRWILLDGERPGADAGTALLGAALLGFAILNIWWLVRDVTRRVQTRRSVTAVDSLR